MPPCWFYFLILYLKLWYWKCQCPTYSSSADDYVQSLTFPSGLHMSRVGRLFCGRWNCCPRPGTRVRFTWSHRSTQIYRTHSTSWRETTGNCSTSAGSTFPWRTHRSGSLLSPEKIPYFIYLSSLTKWAKSTSSIGYNYASILDCSHNFCIIMATMLCKIEIMLSGEGVS